MPYIAIGSSKPREKTYGKRSQLAADYDRAHANDLIWQRATATPLQQKNLLNSGTAGKENLPPTHTSADASLDVSFADLSISDPILSSKSFSSRQSLQPLEASNRNTNSPSSISFSMRSSSHISPPGSRHAPGGPQRSPPRNANQMVKTSIHSRVSHDPYTETSSSADSYVTSPVAPTHERVSSSWRNSDAVSAASASSSATSSSSPPGVAATAGSRSATASSRGSANSSSIDSVGPFIPPRNSSIFHQRDLADLSMSADSMSSSGSGSSNSQDSFRTPRSRRSFLGLGRKSDASRRVSAIQDIRKSIVTLSVSSTSLLRFTQNSANANPNAKKSFPMISMPTPLPLTREKMTGKMITAPSLLSLGPNGQHSQCEEFQAAQLHQLLSLCTQPTVQHIDEFVDGITASCDLSKIGEASFSEVYSTGPSVYKVVPFGNLDQTPVHELMQEIQISRMLSGTLGYVTLEGVYVVQGRYNEKLLSAWDQYARENVSENARADYDEGQLYCVMVMEHVGEPLETFRLLYPHEAVEIFKQVLNAVALAESTFEFEHRDLHWGNIGIQRRTLGLKVTIIDFTLSRARCPESNTLFFTRLDHPDFFRGKGDYQFDVYRQMQRLLVEQSPDRRAPDWAAFEPYTNVLWLHYLVRKLLDKIEQTIQTTDHYTQLLSKLATGLKFSTKRRFLSSKPYSANQVISWGYKQRLW